MRIVKNARVGFLFFILFQFSTVSSFAQTTGTIKGTVKDAGGQPLQGASVQVQGSRGGTSTDNSGSYSINAPTGNQVLIISFVGFAMQRIDVEVTEGRTVQHDISLMEVGDLTNVTVIGSRNASRTRVQTPTFRTERGVPSL